MSASLEPIRALIPASIPEAQQVLTRMEHDIDNVATYEELRQLTSFADGLRVMFAEVETVRQQAERVVLLARHRCGEELAKAPKAKGTRGQLIGRGVIGASLREEPIPTIAEMIGTPKRGHNLKAFAAIPKPDMLAAANALHAMGKEATATAVRKHLRDEEIQRRRERSRSAQPMPDWDFREGDARVRLAEIKDNSVSLIFTDPPWKRKAEPLYVWLAGWAVRVLMPGGKLIVFVPKGWLDRVFEIFRAQRPTLRYYWKYEMQHTLSHHYPLVNVNDCTATILVYAKGEPRESLVIADYLESPQPDKSQHEWGQGGAAARRIIEAHTEPGELVVDPFCGSGVFCDVAAQMGRRATGCDIKRGGTMTIAA